MRRRCVQRVRLPERISSVTLTARTIAAPPASLISPRPNATPMKAEAGIVVTEIATPTAALALVSNASIAATPAARATNTVE